MGQSSRIILDPGKFEGEHISVPHFYDSALDGGSADVYSEDTLYTFIIIAAEDLAEFPDLTEYGLMIWEDSQGFVRTEWFSTRAEYDCAFSDMETAAELEDREEE